MRRTPLALTLLVAAAAALPAAAPAAPAAPPASSALPPLRAALAACSTGATADERFAVFVASMPALPGTRRMAMRFDLYERRLGTRRWIRLGARGFGRWQRSSEGRSGFVYTKRVERLRRGREYRAHVRFRWHGAHGIQRTAARRTAACAQPDQRPNLRIVAVAPAGRDGDRARYRVTVANVGASAAGAFAVAAAEARQDGATVAGLPAGERMTVEVGGPACEPDRAVAFVVDPDGAVDEADERDNAFRRSCPGR
jgi:hypothetical protein